MVGDDLLGQAEQESERLLRHHLRVRAAHVRDPYAALAQEREVELVATRMKPDHQPQLRGTADQFARRHPAHDHVGIARLANEVVRGGGVARGVRARRRRRYAGTRRQHRADAREFFLVGRPREQYPHGSHPKRPGTTSYAPAPRRIPGRRPPRPSSARRARPSRPPAPARTSGRIREPRRRCPRL